MNCKFTLFTAISMLWGSMALSQQDSITVEYDTLPEWDEKIEQYFGLLDTADITTGFHTDRGFSPTRARLHRVRIVQLTKAIF